MARARGSNALMAGAFETTYGVPPGSGYVKLPFASSNLGEEQNLLSSELLGFGREPLPPSFDVINNDGDVVVPVDLRNFGTWLKLIMGQPTSTVPEDAFGYFVFSAQPANNSTITVNGTVFTFVTGTPGGNQIQIGANLAATVSNAADALNASVVSGVAVATYAAAGGNRVTVTADTAGAGGDTFTLAAGAGSNATPSGPTLTGGGNGHVFTSGATALPSMSIEVGLPEVPSFGMNYGVRGNTMRVSMQRSGLLTATMGLIAQGETKSGSTAAGTPATAAVQRFSHFQGRVRREGVDLGHVVSAEFTYSNNLDKVEVIRGDGRIEDADPGMVAMTGNIVVRFADTVLLDQATSQAPCQLEFGWSIDAARSLDFLVHSVYLPRAKTPVTGPQGVQATFAWQASRDPTLGRALTATLVNDVASY